MARVNTLVRDDRTRKSGEVAERLTNRQDADWDARSAPEGRAPRMARVNALVNDDQTRIAGEVAERLNALVLKTSKG